MILLFKRGSKAVVTLKSNPEIIKQISELTRTNKLKEAQALYQDTKEHGDTSIKLYSQGIQISLKQKKFDKAWDILKEYRMHYGFPDTVLYTQMIQAAAMQNNAEKAVGLFAEMTSNGFHLNERTYMALMQAVSNRHDYADQIFDIVDRMKSEGYSLNAHHYVNLIGACGKLRLIEKGKVYWNEIINENHTIHLQLYRKMAWLYYFKISDLLKEVALDQRENLLKSLVMSENIQALCFKNTNETSLDQLISELFTLQQHFGTTDPYIKTLCLINENKALEHIETMTERLLVEIIKSCSLFGNISLALAFYKENTFKSDWVKKEIILMLTRNKLINQALELLTEYPNPRIHDFVALYKACMHDAEDLKRFATVFNHPLDYNLKLRTTRRIEALEAEQNYA